MSIFVSIEDRDGEQLAEVFDLARVHRHFPASEGPCLRAVAEEVDASFNALQLPGLGGELRALGAKDLKQEERAELDRLLKYCDRALGAKGSSLRFYGERD